VSVTFEDGSPEVEPRPRILFFGLSLISVVLPIGALMLGNKVGYLVGYLSVLMITFPFGLMFKGAGMSRKALALPEPTYERQRRLTRWIFLSSSLLAIACAARFAIAVS
jgi:hypothetical protein